jgi:hypothetical protein
MANLAPIHRKHYWQWYGDCPNDFSFKANKQIEPKLVDKFTILAFAEACKNQNHQRDECYY